MALISISKIKQIIIHQTKNVLKIYQIIFNSFIIKRIQQILLQNKMNSQRIKISNGQRINKKNKQKLYKPWTPQKDYRQCMNTKLYKFQKRFGYDYYFDKQMPQSKILKYMQQDFQNKTKKYLGGREWTQKMGRKDKYQKNIQHGRPLKMNPMLKIFNRIQTKSKVIDKSYGLQALKRLIY